MRKEGKASSHHVKDWPCSAGATYNNNQHNNTQSGGFNIIHHDDDCIGIHTYIVVLRGNNASSSTAVPK